MAELAMPKDMPPAAQRAWKSICADYELRECDVPELRMLCEWYAVAERCMEVLGGTEGPMQVLSVDSDGNQQVSKAIAALQMAQASTAAISKRLGIEPRPMRRTPASVNPLEAARSNRSSRMKLVANA